MNPLDLLGPWKYLAYAAIAAVLIGGATYGVHRHNDGLREEGRAEIRAADKAAAEAQTASNRELGRLAELHLSAVATKQERFFTRAAKEIRHVAESLTSCPVPADAVRLLNAARACASEDRPAACGNGDQVPAAR